MRARVRGVDDGRAVKARGIRVNHPKLARRPGYSVSMGDRMAASRQYAVLGPLSSGSENRAFLGCEVIEGVPHPDLPVVVVWLPDEIAKDPKQVSRLQRETAFVTQLRHPNIIRVHGLECFDEGWARVVAFVDGEPLHQILSRAKEDGLGIAPGLAARIVVDACEGVHHAHEEGQSRYAGRPIVHGGIRPDTLLVTFSGITIVTGYGASVLAPANINKQPEKFAYFAPEQIIGGKATASPASDVYALGALLYQLLTGHAPYTQVADIERAILTSEPPAIDDEGVRGRLGNVAATSLAKKGSDRFESVAVMKEAILTALGDEPLAPRDDLARLVNTLIPSSVPERTGRASMLESARDADSVTILSRPTRAPEGVDSALFEAARPGSLSGVNRASQPGEPTEERQRIARSRDENTVIDARPPVTLADDDQAAEAVERKQAPSRRDEVIVEDTGGNRAVAREEESAAYSGNGVLDGDSRSDSDRAHDGDDVRTEAAFVPAPPSSISEDLLQDPPRASGSSASFGQMIDQIPEYEPSATPARGGEKPVQPPPPPEASVPTAPAVARATVHRAQAQAPSDGLAVTAPEIHKPLPPFAPAAQPALQVGAQHAAVHSGGQRPAAHSVTPDLSALFPAAASPLSGRPQPQAPMPAQQQPRPHPQAQPPAQASSGLGYAALPQPPVSARPAAAAAPQPKVKAIAAVPRAPMREDSAITNFDRKAGDSSRSTLIMILGGLAALLAGIFYFATPPLEVQEQAKTESRHALPKELVKAALNTPKEKDPVEAAAPPSDPGTPVNAATRGASEPAAVVAKAVDVAPASFGRLALATEPAVDVYDGNDLLGRTPLTAKLLEGSHKLRFTDKKTGLNVYRTFKVRGGGEQKESISFGTSQLVVEAPQGASILLNSRVVGKAPIQPVTIYEGKYHLKVTLDGKSWADWFDAPAGRQINYKVTLHD